MNLPLHLQVTALGVMEALGVMGTQVMVHQMVQLVPPALKVLLAPPVFKGVEALKALVE